MEKERSDKKQKKRIKKMRGEQQTRKGQKKRTEEETG